MSTEDKLLRRRELKEKSRKRKRGPYRKASSGRLIKYWSIHRVWRVRSIQFDPVSNANSATKRPHRPLPLLPF